MIALSIVRIVIAAAALSVAACHDKSQPPPAAVAMLPTVPIACSGPSTTDPHWVCQNVPRAKTAVVFVHGVFGDTNQTWTNDNGRTFFDLLAAAPGMQSKLDIFAFGFTSKMFDGSSLDIREAANKLESYLTFNGVWQYDQVVFVAHSMGGLISLREVIDHPEHRLKIPLVMLFATPTEGSQITAIANYIVDNPAIKEMFLADGNVYLQQLNDDWIRMANDRPKVACAYEKSTTYGVMIVPWSSATRLCDDVADAIEGATHLTIVKPDRPEHPSVVALVNALNKYAFVSTDSALLDMPDFRADGNHWQYTLVDPNGQNPAHLRNAGARRIAYEVREVSSQKLMVLTNQPQTIDPGRIEEIRFVLMRGKVDSQYSLVIRAPPLADRTIVVSVPDIAAVEQEQRALVQDVSTGISDFLASSETVAHLKPMKEDEQLARVADAARKAVANRIGGLPEGVQWVVTADALASVGWSALATTALRNSERVSPATARSQAAEVVASTVAAQSGALKIFDWQSESMPPIGEQTSSEMLAYIAPKEAERWTLLSNRMQSLSALRASGVSLQGDVYSVTGKSAEAKRAYERASQLRSSPLVDQKMKFATHNLHRDVQG